MMVSVAQGNDLMVENHNAHYYEKGHEVSEEENEQLEAAVIVVIILLLIACSIGFELIKHQIEHAATKKFEKVVDALFGEMTVLGFLSLCTFCVIQSGFFSELSEQLYGDEEELQETFEYIHFGLFFIMIIYVCTVTALINQAKTIESEWSRICQLCHEPTLAEKFAREEALRKKTFLSRANEFFLPDIGGKESLLLYYGLRKEFVLERQMDYPFYPKDKDQRVEPSFNFSMYLSRCLETTLEHIVEVHMPTWIFFAVFSVAYYCLSFLLDHQTSALSIVWVAIEWFALLFCCWFHHHLCDIKRAMGWKISTTRSNAIHVEDTPLLQSSSSSGTTDQLPDWCKVDLDGQAKKKRQNRQQMLFWFREHGPEAYLVILQINLVFTGIYWAMLFLVYFPHMWEHQPVGIRVLYVILAVAPSLLWQKIARNLVASITQVRSVGYLRKHDAVAKVIRDQKIEAMIRAFLALHKVVHSVESIVEGREASKIAAKKQRDLVRRTSSSLSTQARKEVERSFDAIDVSGDGALEPDEITALLGKLGMSVNVEMSRRIVSALDTDGDGVISRDEFVSFYEECILQDDDAPTPKAKAHVLFNIFDTDGDKEITATEFKETLEAFRLGFTLEDIGDLLRELDEDSSGTISLHEFEVLVEKYFPKETTSPAASSPASSMSTFAKFQ